MADLRLRRRHRHRVGAAAEDGANRAALDHVVLRRAGAMSIDVVDLLGGDTALLQCPLHREYRAGGIRARLGEVMRVGADAVAHELTQNPRAAPTGAIPVFEDEDGGPFAE